LNALGTRPRFLFELIKDTFALGAILFKPNLTATPISTPIFFVKLGQSQVLFPQVPSLIILIV
jgi:hypothetical protein